MNTRPHRALPTLTSSVLGIACCVLPLAALAHPGHEAHSAGFMRGLAHPIGGLDHLLAMLAVGVLAMRFQGWQRWLLPLSFLAAMCVGGILGARHLDLPFVEAAIAFSLVAFGLCIAVARTPRFALAASLAGAFALFHGHAHGAEMGAGSAATYSAGFLLATAALHGAGIALAQLARAPLAQTSLRFAGSAVALTGLTLFGAAL